MLEELVADARERGDPWIVGRLFFLAEVEVLSGDWDRAARLVRRDDGARTPDGLGQFSSAVPQHPRPDSCLSRRGRASTNRDTRLAPGRGPDRHRGLRVPTRSGAGDVRALRGRRRSRLVTRRAPCSRGGWTWTNIAPRSQAPSQSRRSSASATFGPRSVCFIVLEEHAAGSDTAARALAHRARALLHASRGDQERAIAELEAGGRRAGTAARGESVRAGADTSRARDGATPGAAKACRAGHARALRRDLRGLGARLWLEKGRSELRRIGGRTASQDQLSETERQIVELVVAGRRNRDVAADLNLSPNTVAWNLSKIYRKLGVSSRTELAARVGATPE